MLNENARVTDEGRVMAGLVGNRLLPPVTSPLLLLQVLVLLSEWLPCSHTTTGGVPSLAVAVTTESVCWYALVSLDKHCNMGALMG